VHSFGREHLLGDSVAVVDGKDICNNRLATRFRTAQKEAAVVTLNQADYALQLVETIVAEHPKLFC
jgi:hypothetical protein